MGGSTRHRRYRRCHSRHIQSIQLRELVALTHPPPAGAPSSPDHHSLARVLLRSRNSPPTWSDQHTSLRPQIQRFGGSFQRSEAPLDRANFLVPSGGRRRTKASHAAVATTTPDTSAATSQISPSRPGNSQAWTSSLITAWAANTRAGHQCRITSMASRVGAAKPKKCSTLSEFGNHSEAPGSPGVYNPYRWAMSANTSATTRAIRSHRGPDGALARTPADASGRVTGFDRVGTGPVCQGRRRPPVRA